MSTIDCISEEKEPKKMYFHGVDIHSKKFHKKYHKKPKLYRVILINSAIIVIIILIIFIFIL